MELALEFSQLQTGYNTIRDFISIKFGDSHRLYRTFNNMKLTEIRYEINEMIPNRPQPVSNKYAILSSKRQMYGLTRTIVTYEKHMIMEFIINLVDFINGLGSYPKLTRCCEIIGKKINEFIMELNNITVEYNRNEITTKEQLETYPIGSLISYTNVNNRFKLGGFITKFAKDYFIWVGPDFETRYRARYSHIQKMWVGDVYKTINDIVSIVPTTGNLTKYPVTVNDVTIYYGFSEVHANNFKKTIKYKDIMRWCEYFG